MKINYCRLLISVCPGLLLLSCSSNNEPAFTVSVEAEELVYKYEPPDNGSGPMWCHGNTCIVRFGDKLVASGMETLENELPLNNTRWLLFERTDKGWELLMRDEKDRTREPSPLGLFDDAGKVILSVNPTLTEPGIRNGPAEPRILQFDTENLHSGYETLVPSWKGKPDFTEHSYRTFVVDGRANEFILLQNTGYSLAEWVFFDRKGDLNSQGQLVWPWGADYEEPQPVRICYPAVQLVDREVHFLGVSDIVEPKKAWKDYKFKLTGREWDYDFRRLFYTWSRDISSGQFEEWVEVASRENTGGHIFPCDLWKAPDGSVHILWTERALDERLHEDFFPEEMQSHALNHAILKEGKIIYRQSIMLSEESDELLPGRGRFQITPENRLFVFYHVFSRDSEFTENRVVEILKDYRLSAPVKVALKRPFSSFFTATVRGGSEPSNIIDVLGVDGQHEMRYAHIRIIPD
ncbi:MAG: hypothetical protein V3V53_06910 [Bacteroidales bacterium]